MQAISTIRILKFNTRQAVRPVTPAVEFEVKPYYTVLYSTSTQDPGVADPPEYDTQDSYGPQNLMKTRR